MNKAWYILYTKARSEKKTAERLNRCGYKIYCPTRKVLKQWSDRKKWVQEPVLPSYIFIACTESEREKVLHEPGVVRFLFWQKKPVIIRAEELEKFKNFLDSNSSQVEVDWAELEIGSQTKILNGPFMGELVEVVESQGRAVVVRFLEGSQGLVLRIRKDDLGVKAKS